MKRILACILLAASPVIAGPPVQSPIATTLGPKLYHDGDVVEITEVLSTSTRLEQGDTVVVKGRVRLDSKQKAQLCLFLTQTEGDGLEETESTQTVNVAKGVQKFELKTTIKHRGALHLTLYDIKTGRPFGGTYFGTKGQMDKIVDWDLSYYLK